MKHVIVAVAALCLVMIGVPVANAAPHGPSVLRSRLPITLLKASSSARLRHALLALPRQRPHMQPGSLSKQAAASLHIDETTFAPAKVDPSLDGTLDNPTADMSAIRSIYHSKNYEDLKRTTGFLEVGNWTPSGATSNIEFEYLASTFPDAPTAQAAFADATASVKDYNGVPAAQQDCSAQGISCYLLTVGLTLPDGTKAAAVGDVIQYNQCLAETAALGPQDLVNSNADQVVKTIQTITTAAGVTLIAACNGTSTTSTTLTYNVVRVQFQKALKANQIPQSTDPALKKAKPGTSVSLVGVLAVTAGPASVSATVSYVIKRSGKIVKQDSQTGTIQPGPNNDTAAVFTFKLPKKVGTYKATMTFQLADQTQQGTASIKVAKK